jgi:hypothetical protein
MTVRPMLASDAGSLEQLQQIVFPALAYAQRLRAIHYQAHLRIFPEGQFVLTNTAHCLPARAEAAPVIGMTTTQRTHFDPSAYQHTFMEVSAGGWLTNHDPEGEWLYGLDMGIHPCCRGRGGARLLYRARQLLVRRLELRGQLTVGMMNGYGAVSRELTGEEYYREWLEGRRDDPTLSRQRTIGFEPLGLIPGYLDDPTCGNYGVLLRLDAGKEV